MRLHVLQAHALRGGHRRKRTDLVHDQVLDLARRHSHLAPSKP